MRNNKGAVPLLTAIILGVLLSVVAIAFVRLAINERRQASDDDLSTAALYAAESGLEDARRAINSYLTTTSYKEADLKADKCEAASGVNSNISDELNSSYSCQLIDLNPDFLMAKPGANNSYLFRIEPVNDDGDPVTIDKIIIKWNDRGNDNDKTPRPNGSSDKNLNTEDWSSGNYPAMLRVSSFATEKNKITIDRIRENGASLTGFINPTVSGSDSYNLNLTSFDSQRINASSCSTSGSFTCQVTLDVRGSGILSRFSSTNWIRWLDITTLYVGDTVKVEALDTSGNPVKFKNAQARVDITGKAGDTYKRIESFIPIGSDNNKISIPNYALVGGYKICKNFYVSDTGSKSDGLNTDIDSSFSSSCND